MTSTEIDTVKRVKTFNNWECFRLICKKFLTQKSNFYQRLAKYYPKNFPFPGWFYRFYNYLGIKIVIYFLHKMFILERL